MTWFLVQAKKEIKSQLAGADRLLLVKQDNEEICRSAGITVACFRSGSQKGLFPEMRQKLARKFVDEYGLSLAEVAQQLGIIGNAVS